LDADDVEGETDQDWREGRAPLSAGDIPNGGSGDPTGIVPGDSGADWAATVAHTSIGLMSTLNQAWEEVPVAALCLDSAENWCGTHSRAAAASSGGRKLFFSRKKWLTALGERIKYRS